MAEGHDQISNAAPSDARGLHDAVDSEPGQADASKRLYDLCGGALLTVVAILTAVHWRLYPVFVDSYYHMEVIHGFRQAGGIVTRAFWEMAPGGRVHIYPPGLHAAGYLASLLGVAPSTFITLVSWACYPACLLTTCLWLRRVAGPRSALFALVLLCSPMAFLFNQAAHTASAAVLVVFPLALWAHAVEEYRICGTLTFLAIAMHPMGLLLPPALTINTLLSRKHILAGLLAAAVPVFLFGPWLAHVWAAREVLPDRFTSGGFSLGGHGVNLGLLLVASAVLGIVWMLVRRGSTLAILGAVLGFGVVFPLGLGGRFLMFSVHWPLACLGGLGLAESAQRLERHAALRPVVAALSLCVAFAALAVFPTLLMPLGPPGASGPGSPGAHAMRPFGPHGMQQPKPGRFRAPGPQRGEEGRGPSRPHPTLHVDIQPAVLPTLLNRGARIAPIPGLGPGAADMIHQPGAEEFFHAVRSNVTHGDVIFVRNPPGAALITGVTGRWTSSGILPGVKSAGSPPKPEDCDFLARLEPGGHGFPQPKQPPGPFSPDPPPGPPGHGGPGSLDEFLRAKKGSGPICAKSPSGRSGKLDLTPFWPHAPPGFEKVFENEFGSLGRNPAKPQHNREPVRPAVPLWLLLGMVASGLALVALDLSPLSWPRRRKLLAAAAIVVVAACLLPLASIALQELMNPPTSPLSMTSRSEWM